MGLTSGQLTLMQAQAEAMMPETVTVQRVTRTNDGQGGWSDSWATVATVAGRFDAITSKTTNAVAAVREAQDIFYTLSVPWDTDILMDDRVTVNGETYSVVETHDNTSWPVTRRARCARLEPAND